MQNLNFFEWTGKIRHIFSYIQTRSLSMIIESFMLFIQKIMLFSSYINNVSSFPKPLTQSEEREYLLKYENGDENAKEVLIQHNLRLVAHVVKKYSGSEEADDLISVGSLGLIKAINTYKISHGTQFSTYAAKCIENEILMLIRANKKHKQNISIDDVLGCDEENNEITVNSLTYNEDENVEKIVENKVIGEKLDKILKDNLTKREYQILCLRFGLNGLPRLAQREVAKKLGISRSYISRLEKKAIEQLKKVIKRSDYVS